MATDVLARATRLRDLARALHDAGAVRQEKRKLEDRHERLSGLHRDLAAAFSWFQLAAAHALDVDTDEYRDLVSRGQDAAVRVQEIAVAFEDDSTILEDRSYTRLESDLTTLATDAGALAEATWTAHVDASTPLVDQELLSALRTVPAFARSL